LSSLCNCVLEVFDGSKLIAYRPATRPSGPYSLGVIFLDESGLVMFRKVMIALFATAALGMLAPDVVSARGGGGGFGGGMHGGMGGGMGGGMRGGFGGGVFHGGGGFGRGGSHAARFNGGRFRGAAIRGRGFRDGFRAGLIAGTSRSAMRTTARNGQRMRVQCFTSDCHLWHSWTE
jgi:hypothetical protein